jgi:hypothetical protein
MNHNPASVRAYQRQLIRDSYARDIKVQQARYIYELHLAQGDGLLAFNKGLPSQAVVDAMNHIFALWRTP